MSCSSISDWGMLAYFLHKEAGPLGILLSHLLHLNSLSELTTKTQVCLETESNIMADNIVACYFHKSRRVELLISNGLQWNYVILTPLGQTKLFWLVRCPGFRIEKYTNMAFGAVKHSC